MMDYQSEKKLFKRACRIFLLQTISNGALQKQMATIKVINNWIVSKSNQLKHYFFLLDMSKTLDN